jgi:tRNA U38,U39,U40 pseudouridine synthase TruA
VRLGDRERAAADRAGRADDGEAIHARLQVAHENVVRRRREEPAVDAIENAAVPGYQRD